MKLVSILMPAYKTQFIEQAITSILNQTNSNFELVIIDDASPENIKDIVLKFEDPRIKYIRNEVNLGGESLVRQWNHCLQYAKGEYLVIASDDDVYHPEFLSCCIDLATRYPEVELIRTGAKQIDENNALIGIDGIIPEWSSKYQFVYHWLNATIFTCMGNYMFKTDKIKEKQFIDFPCAFGSDTVAAISMADKGVASTMGMLFSFRISKIHLSSDKSKLKDKLQANTLLFKWLSRLSYEVPNNEEDRFYYDKIQWSSLYEKCKYDYYNLVIKYLPIYKLYYIKKCELLSKKDRVVMLVRFLTNKLLNRKLN